MDVDTVGSVFVRGVLAAVATVLLLYFPAVIAGGFVFHQGGRTVIFALQVAVVVGLFGVVIVWQSISIRRLWGFLATVIALTIIAALLLIVVSLMITTGPPEENLLNTGGELIAFFAIVYVVSYLLVYRGGYARLKTWAAS